MYRPRTTHEENLAIIEARRVLAAYLNGEPEPDPDPEPCTPTPST